MKKIEDYENLVNGVIVCAFDDQCKAYIDYRAAAERNQTRLMKRKQSDITYLEGWLKEAVPQWTNLTGEYLIKICRKKAKEYYEARKE
jgi:hypothetical protein